MEFGYPGGNTSLENHGVSEESFWPSFTDIMMVIVMVFLLVTVAVILNNWTLIADLKNSIKAQQVASTLAENRKEENIGLESELTSLEEKILLLGEKYKLQQKNLLASQEKLKVNQDKLLQSQQAITERENALSSLDTKLETINQELAKKESNLTSTQKQLFTSQNLLGQKESKLTALQADFERTVKEKNALVALSEKNKKTLSENEKTEIALKNQLSEKETALIDLQKHLDDAKQKQSTNAATITSLQNQQTLKEDSISQLKRTNTQQLEVIASLQTDRGGLEKKVSLLEKSYEESQLNTKNEVAKVSVINSELEALKESQSNNKEAVQQAKESTRLMQDSLEMAQISLKELEQEKQRIIVSMSQSLSNNDTKSADLEANLNEVKKQLADAKAEIKALNAAGNSQLLSLQGEYDSLDAKYKKLLRPARSSKGKFVVSVSYKKKAGKRIIRIKPSPTASYKTVSKAEMNKLLEKLKNKHKADLYIKVIIPEISGLTYNEAWKFTSNLQRKYDYYHQPE